MARGSGRRRVADAAAFEEQRGFDGDGDEDVVGFEADAEAGGDA